MGSALNIIDGEVGARVAAISAEREWCCRRGCDSCCRNLAAPLVISEPEYLRLRDALETIPENIRAEITERIANIARTERPYVCAFLDRSRGECSVYDARPVACRSFGFYVGRDGGRWCNDVERFVEGGGADGVVLGNHDALELRLTRELGPTRPVDEWFSFRGER